MLRILGLKKTFFGLIIIGFIIFMSIPVITYAHKNCCGGSSPYYTSGYYSSPYNYQDGRLSNALGFLGGSYISPYNSYIGAQPYYSGMYSPLTTGVLASPYGSPYGYGTGLGYGGYLGGYGFMNPYTTQTTSTSDEYEVSQSQTYYVPGGEITNTVSESVEVTSYPNPFMYSNPYGYGTPYGAYGTGIGTGLYGLSPYSGIGNWI